MARSAAASSAGVKGSMTHWVEQVLFRPAVGIMTRDTGSRPRLDLLMGDSELSRVLIMALGTKRPDILKLQRSEVGAMRAMAGGAIFSRGRVHGTVSPEFGNFAMTTQTQRRLPLLHKHGMG